MFRQFQSALIDKPKAGDVIRGSGGLRKIRRLTKGRGKRGGARVIYYFQDPMDRIYLIYGYVKSECGDLTPEQLKMLASLMKDVTGR